MKNVVLLDALEVLALATANVHVSDVGVSVRRPDGVWVRVMNASELRSVIESAKISPGQDVYDVAAEILFSIQP
jgi:hypothetical protein